MYGITPGILPAVRKIVSRKNVEKIGKKGIDILGKAGIIPLVPAGVAHPVERHLAKVEVASSSLVTRSRK